MGKKGLGETAARYEGLIRKTAGVCGGKARVRNTRIPVWTLVGRRRHGTSEAGLLDDYPGLTREDLAAVWAYYDAHKAEIDAEIAEEESEDD
jgi:uncharacterized protein (DUF433 family)